MVQGSGQAAERSTSSMRNARPPAPALCWRTCTGRDRMVASIVSDPPLQPQHTQRAACWPSFSGEGLDSAATALLVARATSALGPGRGARTPTFTNPVKLTCWRARTPPPYAQLHDLQRIIVALQDSVKPVLSALLLFFVLISVYAVLGNRMFSQACWDERGLRGREEGRKGEREEGWRSGRRHGRERLGIRARCQAARQQACSRSDP